MSLLRKILLLKGSGGGKKPITPSAWCYFNLEGKIWIQDVGAYCNRISGTGAVYVEEPAGWGAAYFNRQ